MYALKQQIRNQEIELTKMMKEAKARDDASPSFAGKKRDNQL